MAGYHGITGWSGGGRRPLTYNLMPGQMRSTRVNIFPTFNNFTSYRTPFYTDYCDCQQDSGMPKWLQWTMGIGMGTSFLGGLFSAFFGGGGGAEGAGGLSKKDVDAENDLAAIQRENKDYIITKRSDGSVRATHKKTGEFLKADSPLELWDLLDETKTKKTPDTDEPETETKYTKEVAEVLANRLISTYGLKDGDITYDSKTGKLKYGDKLYDYNALNEELTKNNTSADGSRKTAGATSNVPKLFDNMSCLTTEQAVTKKFNEVTGADAVKIDNVGDGGITISSVTDKGNKTTKTGSITISQNQLNNLTTEFCDYLGKFGDKDVYAKNLDGYIQIKVGEQTYIVGKTNDNKYTGYQFENGNVDGFNEVNWRK